MEAARERASRPALAGWVLFDAAFQPWFTLVTTFIFAPFAVARLADDPVAGQSAWGFATGAAGLAIALLSPVLGAIADARGPKKPWIAGFGVLFVVSAAALWLAEPGAPGAFLLALAAFALGTVAAEFATVFNNAMMPTLVPREALGRLSGLGWAIGYVGGLASLVFVIGFLDAAGPDGRTLFGLPPLFGLDPEAGEGARATGPLSALWFLVLVLPLFVFTPDTARRPVSPGAVSARLAALLASVKSLPRDARLGRYLIAHMIYADGLVALFAFGGIYGASLFGWSTIELGLFGILLTLTGTLGALYGGRADDRFGPRAVIAASLIVLTLCGLAIIAIPAPASDAPAGLFATQGEWVYLTLGALIGAAAGPLQSASRTFLVDCAPKGRITEAFGLFALAGKVTSFLAPTLVGLVTLLFDDQRAGVSVILVFFLCGLALLSSVRTGVQKTP
ncbi:MAG: MFS transporter [Hyphomicrobiaceae bacterium]|nr:MFS transporter [Hyphomicrobiaceae bacterium]